MYKNILVISDNAFLLQEFKRIYETLPLIGNSISYSISHFSVKDEFEAFLEENIEVYDLKDQEIVGQISNSFDLIFSIHCKQLFPPQLVSKVKCINVHPGYNPINRGWYPQVFSIIYDTNIGATIHEIDEKLDHGNIIDRAIVKKSFEDTSLTLYNKVVKKEIELMEKNLFNIILKDYKTTIPENEGSLYLKKDFNALCEIKLNEKTSALQLINRLRALSHGNYKNAFFVDPETKKKIYLNLTLEKE